MKSGNILHSLKTNPFVPKGYTGDSLHDSYGTVSYESGDAFVQKQRTLAENRKVKPTNPTSQTRPNSNRNRNPKPKPKPEPKPKPKPKPLLYPKP